MFAGGARTIRPPPPRFPRLLAGLALALLAGCGSTERIDRPVAAPPPVRATPPTTTTNPPSTFSTVVDESIRRKKVVEDLKRVLGESEP